MFNIIEKDITNYSTIRTKAYAKYFCAINNLDDLTKAMDFSKQKKINFKCKILNLENNRIGSLMDIVNYIKNNLNMESATKFSPIQLRDVKKT